MKKLIAFAAFAALIGWSQQIDSVTVRQRWPWSKLVDINYVLTAPGGGSYDVAVQAFNGEESLTIPAAAFAGDVYGVTQGARHIVLDPSKMGYTNVQMLTQFKVQLVPTSVPVYMIVDLTKSAGAEGQIEYIYPGDDRLVTEGPYTNVWFGVTNDVAYKTTKLVMRRVSAGTFSRNGTTTAVTLTKDFYAGVFEFTQAQWKTVAGDYPSFSYFNFERDTRPVERVSYNMLRGSTNATDGGINWPATGYRVNPSSFIGSLRTRTGIGKLDLPTAGQWEYLCRAGVTNDFNNGYDWNNSDTDHNLDAIARYRYNGGGQFGVVPSTVGVTNGTAVVGSYAPNRWGLYDTHGNVWEWGLDWAWGIEMVNQVSGVDPEGPSKSAYVAGSGERTKTGGGWGSSAGSTRAAYYSSFNAESIHSTIGFRVVWPLSESKSEQ